MISTKGAQLNPLTTQLPEVFGSPGWARTSDFLINSQALYRLSYRGMPVPIGCCEAILPQIRPNDAWSGTPRIGCRATEIRSGA